MSQHDLDIANQGFPATRADLNNALQALGSSNSGATAPSTTYANQLWYDTANNIIKIRNEDNDAWISLFTLDQTNDNIEALTVNGTITADALTVDTNTVHVDATNNRLGVGTTSPSQEIHGFSSGADFSLRLESGSATGTAYTYFKNADQEYQIGIRGSASDSFQLIDTTADAARIVVDTNGNVGINNTSPEGPLHIIDGGGSVSGAAYRTSTPLILENNGNTELQFFSNSSNDAQIRFGDGDSNFAGAIEYKHSNNAMLFHTNATERMRILNDGSLILAHTTADFTVASVGLADGNTNHKYIYSANTSTNSGEAGLYLNRQSSDGQLVQFRQANSLEGTISVSGTTVSYNGGHLSRWSRLADNSKDTSIVKGTVMTNLDQMVVWHHDAEAATYYEEGDELPDGVSVGDEKTPAVAAYDEDNEQLNCMAVSSVEGDANVAGVFVNWDNDDDGFNDINIAMTGDMVIRIASGTTVERGDLLMSAGDGTAKPQGDDIVRSKTIAKVTSTTVSHTYDDGSYLVPCVLMAC